MADDLEYVFKPQSMKVNDEDFLVELEPRCERRYSDMVSDGLVWDTFTGRSFEFGARPEPDLDGCVVIYTSWDRTVYVALASSSFIDIPTMIQVTSTVLGFHNDAVLVVNGRAVRTRGLNICETTADDKLAITKEREILAACERPPERKMMASQSTKVTGGSAVSTTSGSVAADDIGESFFAPRSIRVNGVDFRVELPMTCRKTWSEAEFEQVDYEDIQLADPAELTRLHTLLYVGYEQTIEIRLLMDGCAEVWPSDIHFSEPYAPGLYRDGGVVIDGVPRKTRHVIVRATNEIDRAAIDVAGAVRLAAEMQRKDPFAKLFEAKVFCDWAEIVVAGKPKVTFSPRMKNMRRITQFIWEYCNEHQSATFDWWDVQTSFNKKLPAGQQICGKRFQHDVFASNADAFRILFRTENYPDSYRLAVRFVVVNPG